MRSRSAKRHRRARRRLGDASSRDQVREDVRLGLLETFAVRSEQQVVALAVGRQQRLVATDHVHGQALPAAQRQSRRRHGREPASGCDKRCGDEQDRHQREDHGQRQCSCCGTGRQPQRAEPARQAQVNA